MNEELAANLTVAYLRWKSAEAEIEDTDPMDPQYSIGWGSHWMITVRENPLLVSWGYVLTPEELFSARLRLAHSPEDIRQYLDSVKYRHGLGWRLGLEWTCGHPSMVSRHISELWPVLPMEFTEAKEMNFESREIAQTGWFSMMLKRINMEIARSQEKSSNE